MDKLKLRESIKNEWARIVESLLYQMQGEEDYVLDVKDLSKIKTFKHICKCDGQNYREVIKQLQEQQNN
jgi:hypothetical protein